MSFVDEIRSRISKELSDKLLFEPKEKQEDIISGILEEIVPEGVSFSVSKPTDAQFVALRLMGKDIKDTLHINLDISLPVPSDNLSFKIVVPNNT